MSEQEKSGSGVAGVIAIVVVLAYLGLELTGLHRARDRMEPASIYREFIGADRAASVCGAEPEERDDFLGNLEVVTLQALEDLAARRPDASRAEVEEALGDQRRTRESEVDALLAAQGCEGKDLWRLLKLHEIRSRLTLRD